ncbi:unnamed protein product [Gadus morhua 'NCC']
MTHVLWRFQGCPRPVPPSPHPSPQRLAPAPHGQPLTAQPLTAQPLTASPSRPSPSRPAPHGPAPCPCERGNPTLEGSTSKTVHPTRTCQTPVDPPRRPRTPQDREQEHEV